MANPFTQNQAPQVSPGMQLLAPELAAQQLAIQRQQQIAQLLRQQSLESLPDTQVVSGWAVPQSPLLGAAKLAQALAGNYLQNQTDQQNLALNQQYVNKLASMLSGGSEGSSGTYGGSTGGTTSGGTTSGGLNVSNLLKGQAIAALGGEDAAKAYYAGLTPTEMQRQNDYMGITPEQARQLNLAKMTKEGTQNYQPNQTYVLPGGQTVVGADFANGAAGGYVNGQPYVANIPGADQLAANRAGAISSAQEGSKVNVYTGADGKSHVMTNAQALGNAGQSNVPNNFAQMEADVAKSLGLTPGFLPAIRQIESNSTFGAKNINNNGTVDHGIYQINNANKGLNGDNPADAGRLAKAAFDKAGGDPRLAAIYYHGGLGTDPNSAENQRYANKFMKAYNTPNPVNQGMEVQTGAQAEAAKALATEGVKYMTGVDADVQKSGDLMERYKTVAGALQNLKPGAGADQRMAVAQVLQAIGMPKKMVDGVANGSLGDSQTVEKLVAQEGLQQLQVTMASDAGGVQGKMNRQIIDVFLHNNPRLQDDPNALQKLMNLQIQLHQEKLAQANAMHAWADEHNGDVSRFSNFWANQRERSGLLQNTPVNINGADNPVNNSGNISSIKIQQLLDKYK